MGTIVTDFTVYYCSCLAANSHVAFTRGVPAAPKVPRVLFPVSSPCLPLRPCPPRNFRPFSSTLYAHFHRDPARTYNVFSLSFEDFLLSKKKRKMYATLILFILGKKSLEKGLLSADFKKRFQMHDAEKDAMEINYCRSFANDASLKGER